MLKAEDVRYCKRLMGKHGVSYRFAARWFPKRIQDATAVLYAFFRVPDDIVDAPYASEEGRRKALLDWKLRWQAIQAQAVPDHPVLRAAKEVFATYRIPYHYGDAFLESMIQDLTVARYATYADLEKYMYGSAAVVGIMMSYVIGYKDEKTLERAKALGEAMQLTNFIRDVKEDIDERGRIYLPLEDLQRFKVSEDDIRQHRLTPQVIELLKFEIERARALYQFAEPGIEELAREGRFAVRLASRLYAAILRKVEGANYDVFQGRVRTSGFEKFTIAIRVWKATKSTQ